MALTDARRTIAGYLGCTEFDLVWTSGASEANNAVFFHAARTYSGEVWISAIEHPSAVAAAERWFPGKVRLLKVTSSGVVDLNHLAAELSRSRPALVGIMSANNETGVLQPWREALELCRNLEIPFACDAAQWVGKVESKGLGDCDFVVACAHKFGGPPGVGVMKVPKTFCPLVVGGPQEDGRRAGTENVAGILALAAVWVEREKCLASDEMKCRLLLRDEFIYQLQAALPEVEILGGKAPRLWNTVAALMPAVPDCRRRWVVQLDKLGFAVSTGSACSSGREKPSHVLLAMGCERSKADRMLRFSSGWETSKEDWKKLLDGIKEAFAVLTHSL